MIELVAEGIGKKYHRHWVFRHLDLRIQSGQKLLVTGPNGSGKSTLMRVLSGQSAPTAGNVHLLVAGKKIDPELWYRHISWSGPYTELYGDLTLKETMALHFRFKKPLIPQTEIAEQLNLTKHLDKALRHYSSGMLHRVKVGLAIFSESDLLILDEATTNMDEENSKAILDLTFSHLGQRALIYASNNAAEFGAFKERLEMG